MFPVSPCSSSEVRHPGLGDMDIWKEISYLVPRDCKSQHHLRALGTCYVPGCPFHKGRTMGMGLRTCSLVMPVALLGLDYTALVKVLLMGSSRQERPEAPFAEASLHAAVPQGGPGSGCPVSSS